MRGFTGALSSVRRRWSRESEERTRRAVDKALQGASKDVTESAVALVIRALSQMYTQYNSTAVELFREATVKDPEYAGAWFGLGMALDGRFITETRAWLA